MKLSLKQQFFNLVDLKKQFEERNDELYKEWCDTVCWEGTDEEIEEHYDLVKSTREEIEACELELSAIKTHITKEELKAWRKEYYGIN